MPIYEEKPNKLSLKLSDTENPVTLTLYTYYGTESHTSWIFNNKSFKSEKGKAVRIASAKELKKQGVLFFDGNSNNPSGAKIKMEYIITEESGNSIKYTFPDDYTGAAPFDKSDKQPANSFQVNFS